MQQAYTLPHNDDHIVDNDCDWQSIQNKDDENKITSWGWARPSSAKDGAES